MLSVIRSSFSKCTKIPVQSYVTAKKLHTTVIKQYSSGGGKEPPQIAVVLSGCGVFDGSEVHESSAVLVHLSRAGAEITMFAPSKDQLHTINHIKGEIMEQQRNVLIESARIARGKISALVNLNAEDFDAVIFPGGFGAAKNLSTFALQADSMTVDKEVTRVIKEFHTEKKPIGLCCIAPVLAAKLIPGVEVTVGSDQEEEGRWPYAGTAESIKLMGAVHVVKDVTEAHTDSANKVVTTPAFMCEANFHEIFDGIGKMVDGVMKCLNGTK